MIRDTWNFLTNKVCFLRSKFEHQTQSVSGISMPIRAMAIAYIREVGWCNVSGKILLVGKFLGSTALTNETNRQYLEDFDKGLSDGSDYNDFVFFVDDIAGNFMMKSMDDYRIFLKMREEDSKKDMAEAEKDVRGSLQRSKDYPPEKKENVMREYDENLDKIPDGIEKPRGIKEASPNRYPDDFPGVNLNNE